MKLLTKLKKRWQAKTPAIARLAQIALSIITAIFALWTTTPEEFKGVLTQGELKCITFTGIFATVLLQLTKTKDK